jgi:hypothetical protein
MVLQRTDKLPEGHDILYEIFLLVRGFRCKSQKLGSVFIGRHRRIRVPSMRALGAQHRLVSVGWRAPAWAPVQCLHTHDNVRTSHIRGARPDNRRQ